MGNTKCCRDSSTRDYEISNPILIKPTILKNYQNFMNTHPNISRIVNQGFTQKQLHIDKMKLLSQCKEYPVPQGIFIGDKNLEGGRKNGFGVMLYNGGMYYEGEWDDDKKNGFGLLANQEGSYYIGTWKDDLASGKGSYQSKNPQIYYEGEWQNGLRQGKGVEQYGDGSLYTGDFSKDMKNGYGRLIYANKTQYQGDFKNDMIQGSGIFKGKYHTYEGSWKNGKMHGAGKSEWKDQNGAILATYIGEYCQGIKQGFGEYTDSKGVTYKTTWINGEINERGPLVKESLN